MKRYIFILAAMLACLAPQAEAVYTPLPDLSESITSQAYAPEPDLLIEEVYPIGYADDGDCLDMVVCVEQETHTRVVYIVKSPFGLCSRCGDPSKTCMWAPRWFERGPVGYGRQVWFNLRALLSGWGSELKGGVERAAGGGGKGQIAGAVAEGGVTMVPGVGETQDFYIMTDPTAPTWERWVSGGSIGVNVFFAGVLPNYSGLRAGKKGVEATVDVVTDRNARRLVTEGTQLAANTTQRFVRKTLPSLTGSFDEAFEGAVRFRTFKKGQKVYRSPWVPGELAGAPGAWLSTRRTVTKAGTESTANIAKWGNPIEKLRAFEFTEDVTVYYGKVAGGTGYQVLIPDDIDPASVLKFIDEVDLR